MSATPSWSTRRARRSWARSLRPYLFELGQRLVPDRPRVGVEKVLVDLAQSLLNAGQIAGIEVGRVQADLEHARRVQRLAVGEVHMQDVDHLRAGHVVDQ